MASIVETIDLDVPVGRAYEVWADVERWPRFLRHVKDVEVIDARTFRWWLDLPGADTAFEAELTEVAQDKRIAWRTTKGAEHAGVATFHHVTDTTSRVALQIDYEPSGFLERLGALTHLDRVLANYDLGQLKDLIESEA